MKGFPNQIAELDKLASGMRCLVRLVDGGDNPKDDGVFGVALVRDGILGTGHKPMPVEVYLAQQLRKPRSGQSFRTTARGLRELYRLLDFIDDLGDTIAVTPQGRQVASFGGTALNNEQVHFWRRVIGNMSHLGGDTDASHPYQVLLRLIAHRPGITRAMCALALEAKNDSEEELKRIVDLAGMAEEQVINEIEASQSNWDNAKKILPRFAEQLGDVVKVGHRFWLADAPGRAGDAAGVAQGRDTGRRAPRSAREVTPETIARAGTEERSDEVEISPGINPAAATEAARIRRDRLRRHNLLVQALARRFRGIAQLFEDAFDLFAIISSVGVLVEIKTLDGTADDERDRVRDALSQLLYYEAFFTPAAGTGITVRKVACFEGPISEAHREWLNHSNISVIWRDGERFRGDTLAIEFLRDYLEELRS